MERVVRGIYKESKETSLRSTCTRNRGWRKESVEECNGLKQDGSKK